MKLIDNLRKSLDSSGVTSPSKLYTPFTLFCVYFAIYFKAEILGRIFLASDWKIIHSALIDLSSPSAIEWFTFASKVAAYSLGMILLYGLAQAGAVFIWGLSNRLNTWISAKAEAGKYVSRANFEKIQEKMENLRLDNRKLYSELASYHTWKPEDIERLEAEIKVKSNLISNYEKEISRNETEAENKKEEMEIIKNKNNSFENEIGALKNTQKNTQSSIETTLSIIRGLALLKPKDLEAKIPNEILDESKNDNLIRSIGNLLSTIPDTPLILSDLNDNERNALVFLISSMAFNFKIGTNSEGIITLKILTNNESIELFISLLPDYLAREIEKYIF